MLGVEMDHNEAVRIQATEKYVLGELPPPLRNEFDEHFFECQECAQDVKALRNLWITLARFGASPLDNFRNHWRVLAIAFIST